jgi:hypothetical protein
LASGVKLIRAGRVAGGKSRGAEGVEVGALWGQLGGLTTGADQGDQQHDVGDGGHARKRGETQARKRQAVDFHH